MELKDANEALEHINLNVNRMIDAGYSPFEVRAALILKADDMADGNLREVEAIRAKGDDDINTISVAVNLDTTDSTQKLKKLHKQVKQAKKEVQQLADLMELIKSYDVE